MNIAEKVENLSIEMVDEKEYKEFEESLKKYHEMVRKGQLKPRENQIGSTYTPYLFKSNYS